MLRIYSNGFLGNVIIEKLTSGPYLIHFRGSRWVSDKPNHHSLYNCAGFDNMPVKKSLF